MASSNPSRFRKVGLTLLTFAFLAFGVFGYFYFYIQQKEEALHEQNFRVMNQISSNMLTLNATYRKNAENNAPKDTIALKRIAMDLFIEDLALSIVNTQLTETSLNSLVNDHNEIILGNYVALITDGLLADSPLAKFFLPDSLLTRYNKNKSLLEVINPKVKDYLDSQLKEKANAFLLKKYEQYETDWDFRKAWNEIEKELRESVVARELKNYPDLKEGLKKYTKFALKKTADLELIKLIESELRGRSFYSLYENYITLNSDNNLFEIDTVPLKSETVIFPIKIGWQKLGSFTTEAFLEGNTQPTIKYEDFADRYKNKINLPYKFIQIDTKGSFLPSSDGGSDVAYTNPISVSETSNTKFQHTRSFKELMSNVARNDVFDEFAVYRIDSTKENTFQSVFQTFEEEFFARELVRKMKRLDSLQLDPKKRHELEGIPFNIYLKPIHLQFLENEELFLCGLVDSKRFESEKTRIPPLLLLIVSLMAMLIILAFPTLKLALMGKKENLDIGDVFLSLVSMITGTSLIVLLLFNSYRVLDQDKTIRKNQLENLHDKISGTFFDELNSIHQQLNYYDSLKYEGKDIDDPLVTKVLSKAPSQPLYPKSYPYFNTILWSNSDVIGEEVTTAANPTAKVNIAGRLYFEAFQNEQAWLLPKEYGEKHFMVQSILSRATGKQLAVVSTKSQRVDSDKKPIVFLSTNLYSVIRPVLPQGFGFCIINEYGEVLFHSDPSRNLQENFFEECTSKNFNSAIFSRSELYTQGTYSGTEHSFYIKPLDQLPLFLITFEDNSYYRLAHAQTISLNFFFALIFILSALLFLGILYILRPSRNALKHSDFLLDWLRPAKLFSGNYRRLILINTILLILMIWAAWDENAITIVNIILLGNYYSFVLAFLYLNRNSYKEFIWESYQHFFVVMGILLMVLHGIMISFTDTDMSQILTFEVLPLLLIFLLLEEAISKPRDRTPFFNRKMKTLKEFLAGGMKPNRSQRTARQLRNWYVSILHDNKMSYRLFFLSWLTISSFFPTVKFFQISYDYERKLFVQRAHVQLAEDIEARNIWIDGIYRTMGLNENDLIIDNLKKSNIYTQHYQETRFEYPPSHQNQNVSFQLDLISTALLKDTTINGEMVLFNGSKELMKLPIQLTPEEAHLNIDVLSDNQLTLKLTDSILTKNNRTIYLQPDFHIAKDESGLNLTFKSKHQSYYTWNRQLDLKPSDSTQNITALLHGNDTLTFQIREVGDNVPWYKFWKKTDKNTGSIIDGKAKLTIDYYFPETPQFDHSTGEKSFFTMLSNLRPRFNETVRQTNRLNHEHSANGLWHWVIDKDHLQYYHKRGEGGYTISSTFPKYTIPNPYKKSSDILFWLLFVVLIYFLYKLLDFHINSLFAQNIVDSASLPLDSNKALLLNTNEHVFLVVPPAPITTDHMEVLRGKMKGLLNDDSAEPIILDLQKTNLTEPMTSMMESLKIGPQTPFLILDHFDHGIDAPNVCRSRMTLLSNLRNEYPRCQLIIVSSRNHLRIGDILRANASTKEEEVKVTPIEQQGWEENLGQFTKIVYPVEQWRYLNRWVELVDFIQEGPGFIQLSPSRVNSTTGKLKKNHGLGPLQPMAIKLDEQTSFDCYVLPKDSNNGSMVGQSECLVLLTATEPFSNLGIKLSFLESAFLNKRLAHVLSSLNPAELINKYQKQIEQADDEKEKERLEKEKERWKRLLLYLLKGIALLDDSSGSQAAKAQNRILKECAHSGYLQGVQQELIIQFGEGELSDEEIIRKIEVRAQLYYQALWASFSEEEKYLVYDLAKDGLVNGKNKEVFNQLMQKGVVTFFRSKPEIMNKSFRNFILTVIQPKEAMEMVEKVRREGDWSQARTLISVIILGVGAFILLTQNNVMDNTLAFFTGLAAVMPVLRQLLSGMSVKPITLPALFPKKKGKEESKNSS